MPAVNVRCSGRSTQRQVGSSADALGGEAEDQPGLRPLNESAGRDEAFTDDWWVTADRLASMAEKVTAMELTAAARQVLVEATVELLVLLTCWPSTSAPARPLEYLRSRRARMAEQAPWFYDLPLPVRRLLSCTDRAPSLVTFAVRQLPIDDALREAWSRALATLNNLVLPPEQAVTSAGEDHPKLAQAPCMQLTGAPRPRRQPRHGSAQSGQRRPGARERIGDASTRRHDRRGNAAARGPGCRPEGDSWDLGERVRARDGSVPLRSGAAVVRGPPPSIWPNGHTRRCDAWS